MQTRHHSTSPFVPSLPFILLAALLGSLWLAGGASRPDALGQAIVRATAGIALATMLLLGDRPPLYRARPLVWLMGATIVLTVLQLVPLPPELWRMLPGRALFLEAAVSSGQAQPWRPWTIVPDATLNAAWSLIVPVAVLLLVTCLSDRDRNWLPGLVLSLIAASMLLGLLQFSGARINNPLINDTVGEVGGIFANRNHFALFIAMGCLLAPVWTFSGGRTPGWRAPVGISLLLLFVLTILATGSRAGLILGILALSIGLLLVHSDVKKALRRYPRWALPVLVAGIMAMIITAVLVSIAADRAVSISRVFAVDSSQDMRSRALPTVLDIIRTYFPVGTGLGSFDPIFRIHEPLKLLKFTYFNHAHNDYLEVLLDAGLPGMLLLTAALSWWVWASVRSWRSSGGARDVLPRLGSAMLLLVIVASIFDYPARTPMIMAMMVLAASWLNGGVANRGVPALPKKSLAL